MKLFYNRLVCFLEALVCLCFFSFFVMVLLLVVLRYLFNSSITGGNEIITILFVYTTAIGAALAVGRRDHIAINILKERMSMRMARHLNMLQLALVGAINFALVWFRFPWISQTGDNLMPTIGIARSVVQLSIPIGCGLAVLFCIATAIVVFEEAKTGGSEHSKNRDHSS